MGKMMVMVTSTTMAKTITMTTTMTTMTTEANKNIYYYLCFLLATNTGLYKI